MSKPYHRAHCSEPLASCLLYHYSVYSATKSVFPFHRSHRHDNSGSHHLLGHSVARTDHLPTTLARQDPPDCAVPPDTPCMGCDLYNKSEVDPTLVAYSIHPFPHPAFLVRLLRWQKPPRYSSCEERDPIQSFPPCSYPHHSAANHVQNSSCRRAIYLHSHHPSRCTNHRPHK